VFGSALAAVLGASAAAASLWCWYLQPLMRRRWLYRNAPFKKPARLVE
jgi:O-antigen/teichoic acid export membrane protein